MNPSTRVMALFGPKADPVAFAALAGNAEVGIKVSNARSKILLRSVQSRRSAGASVTNHQPRVGNVAGFASGSFAQKYEEVATLPGTMVHSTEINSVFYTDTDGKFYFTPGGDAADTFEWEIVVEPLT